MADIDPIVISFENSLLRKSDIFLLSGPYWLNDKLIAFMYDYYEKILFERQKKDLLFISPDVTQCIKLSPYEELKMLLEPLELSCKQLVFLPVNDNDSPEAGGSHWSLLVFMREDNTFHHFDSAGWLNLQSAQHLARKLEPYLKAQRKIDFMPDDCPQQHNSYDCGLYVLCITEYICDKIIQRDECNIHSVVTFDTVNRKRGDILHVIDKLKQN